MKTSYIKWLVIIISVIAMVGVSLYLANKGRIDLIISMAVVSALLIVVTAIIKEWE